MTKPSGCTCTGDTVGLIGAVVQPVGADPECPWHGRHPYMACDACNYETHQCPMCGDPVEHWSSGLCAADEAELRKQDEETERNAAIDRARS
jgi:hypothetical protein